MAQQSQNRFVEIALAYALTYASAVHRTNIAPASITILADTDYYSCPGPPHGGRFSNADRFLDFGIPLNQAHKTGLGSSAALVTAFTAAVVAHYVPASLLDVYSEVGKLRIHNLAQAAHCAAQGKVGSGFDVAAAVYGSCVYRRFSPHVLNGLGEIGEQDFSGRLKAVIENVDASKQWDMQIDKGSAIIPKGLRLVMCDVDCGSETVGMVKNVLKWRTSNPDEAFLLWATLQKGNEDLANELQSLALASLDSRGDYDNLKTVVLTIRSLIREMSHKSSVPIEPPVQTALIDSCCQLPGVVGGVVPGAGGFDAIALLVKDEDSIIDGLRAFLEDYRIDSGQSASIGKVRLLSVKQDDRGVHNEDVSVYGTWI